MVFFFYVLRLHGKRVNRPAILNAYDVYSIQLPVVKNILVPVLVHTIDHFSKTRLAYRFIFQDISNMGH